MTINPYQQIMHFALIHHRTTSSGSLLWQTGTRRRQYIYAFHNLGSCLIIIVFRHFVSMLSSGCFLSQYQQEVMVARSAKCRHISTKKVEPTLDCLPPWQHYTSCSVNIQNMFISNGNNTKKNIELTNYSDYIIRFFCRII